MKNSANKSNRVTRNWLESSPLDRGVHQVLLHDDLTTLTITVDALNKNKYKKKQKTLVTVVIYSSVANFWSRHQLKIRVLIRKKYVFLQAFFSSHFLLNLSHLPGETSSRPRARFTRTNASVRVIIPPASWEHNQKYCRPFSKSGGGTKIIDWSIILTRAFSDEKQDIKRQYF
jgi:hypothetical protein